MIASHTVEDRLEAVEAELSRLKLLIGTTLPPVKSGWLDRLSGSQAGEPAFDEVVALGRAFRAGHLPDADQ